MSDKIRVDSSKCIRCEKCRLACPMLVFGGPAKLPPTIRSEDGCIECGHCVALCPVGAIQVGEMTSESFSPACKADLPSWDSFAALVKYRRSIRDFKPEKIRQADLDALFEILRWAPTAKNRLPLRWTVVNDPEKVHKLAGIVVDSYRDKPEAQMMVAAWDAGIDWIHRGAPCLAFASGNPANEWTPFDSSIAAEIMDLAAPLLGLGTCWAGFFIRAAGQVTQLREALGLAPEEKVGGALMIGYPNREEYTRVPTRPECSVRYL